MGFSALFYPWGLVLQAIAILHFVRRRPDTYWIWIILIGGGLGALVYIVAEMLPDVNLVVGSLEAFSRRRRIRQFEQIVIDNPAVGNLEELADLLLGKLPDENCDRVASHLEGCLACQETIGGDHDVGSSDARLIGMTSANLPGGRGPVVRRRRVIGGGALP